MTRPSLVKLHTVDSTPLDVSVIAQKIQYFPQGKVLIIGDIMVDRYLHGDANRVSPEAPVPVVLVEKEAFVLGGAGNVARNIIAMGGSPILIGGRGEDTDGDLLETTLKESGIPSHLVPMPGRPTTVKLRILARKQQMLRIDWEDANTYTPEHSNAVLHSIRESLDGVGAIIISDYGKGLVSAYFMEKLHAILEATPYHIPVLVDPKPQNTSSYKNVTLLTPNAKETGDMANAPVHHKQEILEAGKKLLHELQCPYLITTLGADGMAVFHGTESVWHIPTAARQVYDVTGAGDTVIATIALALACGCSLLEAAVIANHSAGLVVAQVGAGTASAKEIEESLLASKDSGITQWL